MNDVISVVAAICGILGAVAGLSSWSRVRAQNKKDCSDASESVAAAAKVLIEPLSKRVDDLERELLAWKNWAQRLVKQVRGMGMEPEPFADPVTVSRVDQGKRQW